eukprot:TRINITY_DN1138_c0_g1_i2.p1 TRINITY_DN1138_c0_g1~~TRINITY_DN1138_c0_g1_i2.p1  ORF type:complete len:1213 (+),score=198.12 TRINITY_DN1138_c0_g1_i2:1976-5614(+)
MENPDADASQQSMEGDDIFEVEKLLGKRTRGKTTEYLVKWLAFNNDYNTWEPAHNLGSGCRHLIEEYEGSLIINVNSDDDDEDVRKGQLSQSKTVQQSSRYAAPCVLCGKSVRRDGSCQSCCDGSVDVILAKRGSQYLVRPRGLAFIHCEWADAGTLESVSKRKLLNFDQKLIERYPSMPLDADVEVWSEGMTPALVMKHARIDRVVAEAPLSGHAVHEKHSQNMYLVKWQDLPYEFCTWEPYMELCAGIAGISEILQSDTTTQTSVVDTNDDYQDNSDSELDTSAVPQMPSLSLDEARAHVDTAIIRFRSFLLAKSLAITRTGQFQELQSTPKYVQGSLHPYQLEGVNWLRFAWSKKRGVILADEMGLGKTVQAIVFLSTLHHVGVGPFLVVAPLSTLTNWAREAAAWAPRMNTSTYYGSAKSRQVLRKHELYVGKVLKVHLLLVAYEVALADASFLKSIPWACVIVDEGHRLKNSRSRLFGALEPLSGHRVLLTGTPLQNNVNELISLLQFIKADTAVRAATAARDAAAQPAVETSDVEQLHDQLRPFILRRLKREVLTLPPKSELLVPVDLSTEQRGIYRAIMTRNIEALRKKSGAKASLSNIVMELQKCCNHPYLGQHHDPGEVAAADVSRAVLSAGKLDLVMKLLHGLRRNGHRVLIFSQMVRMLDILHSVFAAQEWPVERLDGSTALAARQQAIDRFNDGSNREAFVFLISTKAGSLGINLTSADTVILYDSSWNPHVDFQALARAHRFGQQRKVVVYRMITRGTIEERMIDVARAKLKLEATIVRPLAVEMSRDELRSVLKAGATVLAEDTERIVYDDAAVEKLLDRSAMLDEDDNIVSAVDAFKVARVWGDVGVVEENDDQCEFWNQLLGVSEAENMVKSGELLEFAPRAKRTAVRLSYNEAEDQPDDVPVPNDKDSDAEDCSQPLSDSDIDMSNEVVPKIRSKHAKPPAKVDVDPAQAAFVKFGLTRFGRDTRLLQVLFNISANAGVFRGHEVSFGRTFAVATPWTAIEKKTLKLEYRSHGNQWHAYQSVLPGRAPIEIAIYHAVQERLVAEKRHLASLRARDQARAALHEQVKDTLTVEEAARLERTASRDLAPLSGLSLFTPQDEQIVSHVVTALGPDWSAVRGCGVRKQDWELAFKTAELVAMGLCEPGEMRAEEFEMVRSAVRISGRNWQQVGKSLEPHLTLLQAQLLWRKCTLWGELT